jgi:hypothetical protein
LYVRLIKPDSATRVPGNNACSSGFLAAGGGDTEFELGGVGFDTDSVSKAEVDVEPDFVTKIRRPEGSKRISSRSFPCSSALGGGLAFGAGAAGT